MIIINFTHPLTTEQQIEIEKQTGQKVMVIHEITCHFDNEQPFAQQIVLLVGVDLTAEAWQIEPILINPPAYAPVTATLLAELHGRIGYFPAIIRIRPKPDTLPPQYEVAEIINLQHIRDTARKHRVEGHKNGF